jgi:hypothetical protein
MDPEWEAWMGRVFKGFRTSPPQLTFDRPRLGGCAAIPGQWIIKYGEGDFQSLPESTFHEHYEAVED